MQNSTDSNPIVFEIPYYGEMSFATLADAQEFLREELEKWNWLNMHPVSNENNFHNLRRTLNQLRTKFNEAPGPQPHVISDVCSQFFKQIGFPYSASPLGMFLLKLAQRDSLAAAYALAVFLPSQHVQSGISSAMKGQVLALLFQENASVTSLKNAIETADGMAASVPRLVEKLKSQTSELQDRVAAALVANQTSFDDLVSGLKADSRQAQEEASVRANELEARANEAVQRINDTDNLYKKAMELEAPYLYWEAEAQLHSAKSKTYRNLALSFALFTSGVVLALLLIKGDSALQFLASKHEFGVYAAVSYLTLAASTLILWIGRLLVRLYLSEHHLMIDAAERAIMAKTYLALAAAGKVSDGDRTLVLGPLFRSSSDGIVKDDAAPDFSAPSVLSKWAANQK